MNLLLDTHIFLWSVSAPRLLSDQIGAAITDPANDLFISAATIWEVAIKRALGRLEFPIETLDEVLVRLDALPLPISLAHAVGAGALPRHHDDPFDRMLIAQARLEDMVLVSTDAVIARYEVRVLAR